MTVLSALHTGWDVVARALTPLGDETIVGAWMVAISRRSERP
jgi:hypothetical protein